MKLPKTKFIIMIFSIFYVIAFSEEYCEDNYKLKHIQIFNDFKKIKESADSNHVLANVNVFWPNCEKLKLFTIDQNEIPMSQKTFARQWFLNVNSCSRSSDTTIFIRNMEKGDDWVISCTNSCGVYAQMIDGRTLTVLIEDKNSLVDTINFQQRLLMHISKYINLRALNLKSPHIIFLKKDSSELQCGIIESGTDISKVQIQNLNVLLWVNNNYIVIDIMKRKKPFKYKKYDYSPAEFVIGGISRTDSRPFVRFGNKGVFDYDFEMNKDFPWVKDSIKAHQPTIIEVKGQPPAYILDEK